MSQFGGKDSKRNFTVVIEGKEHGLYVSSTPSSAAKKAVTKLCASNKGKKVEFHIREITQGSKKKTYGPYVGYIEKLKEPIELKGRIIKYKPIAKLSGKLGVKKGGGPLDDFKLFYNENITKAQDKLKRMTETEGFIQLSLDEKNAILLQWAQEWNNKILQKFIDKKDEYSKKLVKMIQEGKITIFNPKKEIKYEGDEYVTIDFLKINDIIPKIVGFKIRSFVNSNNNNNTFFVNPVAGPAQNYSREDNHPELLVNSRNNKKDLFLGTEPELLPNNENSNNKIEFPRIKAKAKAKNKIELKALVKYFNILNKYYKMWSEYYSLAAASESDLDEMLKSELLDTFKNITENNIKESLEIIKNNFTFLRELKNYIDGSIQKNPTWGRDLTVDELFTPVILTKLGYIDHNDKTLRASDKLPIPDYYIGNWSNKQKYPNRTSNRNGRPVGSSHGYHNPIGNSIVNYKQSLGRLAKTLKNAGIEWNDKTDIFVNSVINFLQKYYQNPTPNQLDIAIKVVRMSLLPSRSLIPYQQIFTDSF